jgi:hypothetical protein
MEDRFPTSLNFVDILLISTVVQNLLMFRILRMLFRTFALAEAASQLAPWPPPFRRILDPLKR